jgi:hypothetical protein
MCRPNGAVLTRIEQDLYRDALSRLLVATRSCYQHLYGSRAVLEYERGSPSNRVHFEGTGSSCAVRGIYRPNLTLTRVGDDLYRDDGTGRYLRTFACYEYVYGEDALILDDRVIFVDSRTACDLGL